MNWNETVTIIGGIIAAINGASLVYFAWKKLKPEVKKMEGEAESELQEAANLNLEGAKVSAQMLLDRINELKGELDTERTLRREGMAQAEKSHKESLASLEKSRREDIEYFRRRIKDLDRELRAYRSWAATLTKQVVEAGKIPAQLVLSLNDSEPSVTSIRYDLEVGDEE
jgi:predicted RNase H-like nuclease (RuvC/YqgF family)